MKKTLIITLLSVLSVSSFAANAEVNVNKGLTKFVCDAKGHSLISLPYGAVNVDVISSDNTNDLTYGLRLNTPDITPDNMVYFVGKNKIFQDGILNALVAKNDISICISGSYNITAYTINSNF